MGGGIPFDSTAEEDDSWAEFPHENQSPWASDSGFEVEHLRLASSSKEEVLSAAGVSTFTTGQGALSTYESHGPAISWSVESDARDNYVQRGDFSVLKFNERESQVAILETVDHVRDLNSEAKETAEDVQLSKKVSTDLQRSSVTTSTRLSSQPTSESLQHVRKRTFKLMQIENDNQDLSFVEKVILSREEIFGLCNNITAGSAKSSEGRRVIDFGSLDSKSMKVVGFFGSKDVMREIFMNTKFREQRDIWMQTQNDTLAPGLYAWLEGDFVFVFYWHQGHSLPEATRKDMSCNFIRYVFDLCDTVCVCVDAKNLKNSLFESAPRFSKRQRTQRLQISLVKASEDTVKVADGFLLEGLSLGSAKALPVRSKSRKNLPLKVAFGHDYKVSEGVSRVALLFSSTRPQKLSSLNKEENLNVSAFPAFIKMWTVDREYSLDLRNLSDSDFVVFIRSAKLKEAGDFDKLVARNAKRREEEKNKIYSVDQFVEKKQQHLSRCLETFIDSFFKTKYPWEENLMLLNSGAHRPMALEARSNAGQSDRQSGEAISYLISSNSTKLSTTLNRIQSELPPPRAEEAQEVTQDRLNQLEDEIYNVLVENSKQRMVFPNSVFYIFNPSSRRFLQLFGERGPFVFTVAGPDVSHTSEFVPICYGQKVNLRLMKDVSVSLTTGKVQRYHSPNTQGLLLTNEEIVVIVDGSGQMLRMALEPARRKGDLIDWLNQQAADMESPRGWKNALLVTTVARELADHGLTFNDLSVDLARKTLVSENPLDLLQTILPIPILEFARRNWEHLRVLHAQRSAEIMHQTAIVEPWVKDLCVDLSKEFRSNLQSRISAQTRRFTTSLLDQKVRKQLSESYERLEATLKEEEAAFLASQKDALSRKKEGTGPFTLTFVSCKLVQRSGVGWTVLNPMKWREGGQKLSINLIRQEFEKESITWYGLELAPMKEDLDQLIIDNEYAFSPSCSATQEIIDLDPTSQTLLKVVFLKEGLLLVFIVEGQHDSKDLLIYLCPKLGVKLSETNCIRKISRGFDLIAYDERSRFIALYDGSISTIKTYRVDETFRHMDWTGIDISLGEYSIRRLIWMDFVIGKSEIVFIDDLHRVRLCDVNQPGMVRSGNVHIGKAPIVKAFVTTQGSCLLLLRNVRHTKATDEGTRANVRQQEIEDGAGSGDDHESEGLDTEIRLDSGHPPADSTDTQDGFPESTDVEEQTGLTLDVYKLDDSIQYFSSIPLDTKVKDWSKLEVGLVSYSSQMHLVIFDSEVPSEIFSKVIKISSASEVCQLQQVTRPEEEAYTNMNPEGWMASGPVLDYIYQVFEKYATSPPLSKQSRDVHLRVVLKGSDFPTNLSTSLSGKCLEYVNTSLDRLRRDKGKDFSALDMHISVHDADKFRSCIDLPWSVDGVSQAVSSAGVEVQMGTWMRKLVCLVPIQIARAEHNALKPMIDGLQLSSNVDYVDAISLANVMRVGLYEAVFDTWKGPVKVISSMGKQSSGKSYLLNHLSGSLLDVAGGRCTDGVWMSLRQGDGCLYVLLDFEGLGSFERSEQEDMLLSMLNAAISNLTIFNKKGSFQLFSRFSTLSPSCSLNSVN